MSSRRFREGLRVQLRVIVALTIRELTTRFGRENIGFLWIMVEPLLFAGLVSTLWYYSRGDSEHGISIIAFVVTGYIPLTFLRQAFQRCVSIFIANGSLMYHRQIRILDFVLVRVLIEMAGAMMAFVVIAGVLIYFDLFPMPDDIGRVIGGWLLYALFIFSVCLIIAPLSEMSEVLEKIMPVTVYLAIPFAGTFNMAAWLSPGAREFVLWSPLVNAMELLRYGVFGATVRPYYDVTVSLAGSGICMAIGLLLCRVVRRRLVVE